MALVGGIVSIYGAKQRTKAAYVVGFFTLGVAIVCCTIWQSKETAAANMQQAKTSGKLESASQQIIDLQIANSALQQQLLGNTRRLQSSADENHAIETGGDSACYMDISTNPGSPIFIHIGKYPLYSIQVIVTDVNRLLMLDQKHLPLGPNLILQLAGLQPGKGLFGASPNALQFTDSNFQAFNVFFSAKNGDWSELLRIAKTSDGLKRAILVVRARHTKGVDIQELVFESIPIGFPKEELASDKSWVLSSRYRRALQRQSN